MEGLTREQAREIDRHAIQALGLAGVVLMENAGRGCVDLLERVGVSGPTAILCGSGANGGDGFVIARHLMLRGYQATTLLLAPPAKLKGDAATNYAALEQLDASLIDLSRTPTESLPDELHRLGRVDWWIDAMLGTGAAGAPREPLRTVIDWVNEQPSKRLAVDLPSGLDCDTGEPAEATFLADHTVTFVAPKAGFANPNAERYSGKVHVADIGVPPLATPLHRRNTPNS